MPSRLCGLIILVTSLKMHRHASRSAAKKANEVEQASAYTPAFLTQERERLWIWKHVQEPARVRKKRGIRVS